MRAILVLFLFAGSAGADEPRFVVTPKGEFLLVAKSAPKCSYCTDCNCKDGDCPNKCAVTSYRDLYARVERGERITATVGAGGVDVPGMTPGVYDCFLVNGRPHMQQVVHTAFAPVSQPVATQSSGYTRVCGPNGCKLVPVGR